MVSFLINIEVIFDYREQGLNLQKCILRSSGHFHNACLLRISNVQSPTFILLLEVTFLHCS